ncbi:MAG: hypothetical protein ACI8PZ_002295 [Myxococcota bacterium]|jgi:hypothetical protein
MSRLSILTMLTVLACSPEGALDAASWSPDGAAAMPAPGDMTLEITPMIGGAPANFTVTGAPPGANVFLVFSPNTVGPGACPPPLSPDCLDIPGPVSVLTSARADGAGVVSIDIVVPNPVPAPEAAFQAVSLELDDNHTTNAVIRTLHPPASDLDGDGLDAITEFEIGTDPDLFDTDGGGVGDGEEVSRGTDPTDPTDDVGGPPGVDTLEPGDILVTEFIKDPSIVLDVNGEWIEIHSMLDVDVELAGLEISDLGSDSYTVVGPLLLPAGGYVVLGRNADMDLNGGVFFDEAYGSELILANGDDEIVLSRPDGAELASIIYDDGILWPDSNGKSIQLRPGGDPSNPADWCQPEVPYGDGTNDGTPGMPNPECPLPITYTRDIEPILADNCYSCHGGAAASGGRNFDTYDELFQASADVPGIQLITPFLLEESYIFQKVSGTQADVGGAGSRMPLGGLLSDDDILLMGDWIEDGAPE